jgi:hypothetical protein
MFDRVLTFAKVVASSVRDTVALYNLAVGPSDEDDEQAHEQEVFSGLGWIARPRAPSLLGSALAWAEVIAARTSDGLVAFGFRDLRLHARFPNPKAGSIAFVAYGGGFHSFDDTTADSGDEKASISVLYVPYAWSGGAPTKAMTITVDPSPGNESVTILHGEGQLLGMTADGAITMQSESKTAAPKSVLRLDASGITMQADSIVLNGSVSIGDPTAAAPFPLLAGPASPPCPRLFLSPIP